MFGNGELVIIVCTRSILLRFFVVVHESDCTHRPLVYWWLYLLLLFFSVSNTNTAKCHWPPTEATRDFVIYGITVDQSECVTREQGIFAVCVVVCWCRFYLRTQSVDWNVYIRFTCTSLHWQLLFSFFFCFVWKMPLSHALYTNDDGCDGSSFTRTQSKHDISFIQMCFVCRIDGLRVRVNCLSICKMIKANGACFNKKKKCNL